MKRLHDRHSRVTRVVCLVTLFTFIAQPLMAQGLYEQYTQFQNPQNQSSQWVSQSISTGRGEPVQPDGVEQRFDRMSTYERTVLFNSIGDEKKKALFSTLSDGEQKLLLDKLSDAEKRRLLSSMDKGTLNSLLKKFPDLEGFMEGVGQVETPQKQIIRTPRPVGPSRIEQLFAGTLQKEISEPLVQFGYAGFEKDLVSFTPLENVPVSDDYVIGPDDNFTIWLYRKPK